jgi:SAM-dependent methyltransferase
VTQAHDIAELVSYVQDTEHRYLLHGPRHDPVVTPWMPYQPADFVSIVWECMPLLAGNYFMDVGCGPGTKMQIAVELFGLQAFGIEIDSTMVKECRAGVTLQGDALTDNEIILTLYRDMDLIWLYRPFREAVREKALEDLIMAHMKPGAILAGSSWETDVPSLGWEPVVDDCLINQNGPGQIIRGAWKKPRA